MDEPSDSVVNAIETTDLCFNGPRSGPHTGVWERIEETDQTRETVCDDQRFKGERNARF
jgi:hypothetical protein